MKVLAAILVFTVMFSCHNERNLTSSRLVEDAYMKYVFHHAILSEGLSINNNLLSSYLNENEIHGSVLIIRYSAFGCKTCIEYIYKVLQQKYGSLSSRSNIMFVVSDINLIKSHEEYGNTVFLPKNQSLGLALEQTKTPFLFILDHGKVSSLFIPNIHRNTIFEAYLSAINERYDFLSLQDAAVDSDSSINFMPVNNK